MFCNSYSYSSCPCSEILQPKLQLIYVLLLQHLNVKARQHLCLCIEISKFITTITTTKTQTITTFFCKPTYELPLLFLILLRRRLASSAASSSNNLSQLGVIRSSWQTRIHFSNLHINRASYSAPLLLHDYICHSFDSLKKLEFARQQKSCRPRFTTLSKVLLLLL